MIPGFASFSIFCPIPNHIKETVHPKMKIMSSFTYPPRKFINLFFLHMVTKSCLVKSILPNKFLYVHQNNEFSQILNISRDSKWWQK